MVLLERLYTAEEFFEFANLPENEERRLELDDGVIVDMGSSSRLNTVTGMRIGTFINTYVIANDLGFVSGADGGYVLGPRRVRRPDVGYLSKRHNVELKGVEFDIAPDLAVEVVSHDEDIFKKVTEYLTAGTQRVWAIYPDDQRVYVFYIGDDGEVHARKLGIGDTLSGEDVLPGFSIPVRDIFPS